MKRVLKIPLPRIPGSLFCPAQALLLSFKMAPANNSCSPAFLYKNGTKVIPLTYSVFLSKLKRFLQYWALTMNRLAQALCKA